MKGNSLLIGIMILSLQACGARDTTNPQASNSIKASKKNGFFAQEYYTETRQFDSLKIEEAWLEKIWYNENNGSKTTTDAYQLCFKIKQVPGGKFQLIDVFSWKMREHTTRRGVAVNIEKNITGSTGGLYVYEVVDKNSIPDSLLFDLIIMSNHKEINVGNLMFKKKK